MEGKKHKELKEKGLNYLWNKGYRIARKEFDCGYYGIYDAWGICYHTYYTMGVEVKVSRADFLAAHKYKERRLAEQDTAFKGLLRWGGANESYYICPSGLIQPEETGVYGLLWFNGNRIVNKKKPKFIKISPSCKMEQLVSLLEPKPF